MKQENMWIYHEISSWIVNEKIKLYGFEEEDGVAYMKALEEEMKKRDQKAEKRREINHQNYERNSKNVISRVKDSRKKAK